MPQIDQLADGGALRADDDIPIERAAGTRKAHGFPTDPPGVSDTGTDTYAGNFGRDVNDEEIVAGMVDSANTSTTPTLENTGGTPTGAKTITLPDGSALRVGALQNTVHIFQYDSATDTWLLLNPFGDYLVKPGTSSDPALAFDTWRTPNANRPTLVEVFTRAETDGTTDGTIQMAVDESGGTTADYTDNINLVRNTLPSETLQIQLTTFIVPAGGSYQILNTNDPTTNNAIREHREFTL